LVGIKGKGRDTALNTLRCEAERTFQKVFDVHSYPANVPHPTAVLANDSIVRGEAEGFMIHDMARGAPRMW
jgi:hypothetical protein